MCSVSLFPSLWVHPNWDADIQTEMLAAKANTCVTRAKGVYFQHLWKSPNLWSTEGWALVLRVRWHRFLGNGFQVDVYKKIKKSISTPFALNSFWKPGRILCWLIPEQGRSQLQKFLGIVWGKEIKPAYLGRTAFLINHKWLSLQRNIL